MSRAALHTDEIALPDLVTPVVARAAGATLVAAGLFGVASAIEVLALFDGALPTLAALPLLVASLVASITAPFVYDGRGWATIVGLLAAVSTAGLSLVWIGFATFSLVFAPTLFLAFVATAAALAVLPFSVGPAFRLSMLRRALQG
jgi:hypothetical protein